MTSPQESEGVPKNVTRGRYLALSEGDVTSKIFSLLLKSPIFLIEKIQKYGNMSVSNSKLLLES